MDYLHRFVRKYPFSIVCIALIWILSLTPIFPETPLHNVKFADKWAHLVMYGSTCVVIWTEYVRQHQTPDYGKLLGLAGPHPHERSVGTFAGILYRHPYRKLARLCCQCHRRHIRSCCRTAYPSILPQTLKGFFRRWEL